MSQTVTDFVTLAIQAGGWMEMDRLYLQNRVIGLIGEHALEKKSPSPKPKSSLELLDELVQQALKNGVIEDTPFEKETFEAQLMDLLTPPPSVVNAFFAQHYANSPEEATDYFYELSKTNNSVKTEAIAKNIIFPIETEYGQLEMMIRSPKMEVAFENAATKIDTSEQKYPKCPLCMENEGYQGQLNYPARTNHRIIRMNLDGESWGFHYAPYGDYKEQAIIASEEHRPLKVTQGTFRRLLKITEVLPHYFVGVEADLPSVNSLPMTHEHYEAGRQTFPLEVAEIEIYFELADFPLMNAGIVKWPMSVIRLQSPNQEDLIQAGELILEKWRNYSDDSVSIKAYSEDGSSQHSITSIARRKENLFELDLVLRDSNVSKEQSDSHFYSHKQNFGLAEVLGLSVLPSGLEEDLKQVENYVLEQSSTIESCYQEWADSMKKKYSFTEKSVTEIIREELGQFFVESLKEAGVYKRNEQGKKAFQEFINALQV